MLLAKLQSHLGTLLIMTKNADSFPEAEKHARQSLENRRWLHDLYPTVESKRELALSLLNMGALYLVTGKKEEAAEYSRESRRLWEELEREFPDDPRYGNLHESASRNLERAYD